MNDDGRWRSASASKRSRTWSACLHRREDSSRGPPLTHCLMRSRRGAEPPLTDRYAPTNEIQSIRGEDHSVPALTVDSDLFSGVWICTCRSCRLHSGSMCSGRFETITNWTQISSGHHLYCTMFILHVRVRVYKLDFCSSFEFRPRFCLNWWSSLPHAKHRGTFSFDTGA